jgi:hypothetical protein
VLLLCSLLPILILAPGCDDLETFIDIADIIADMSSSSRGESVEEAVKPRRSQLGERYPEYLEVSLEEVVRGHAEGERLLGFLEDRARKAVIRDGQVFAVESGHTGTHFWVAFIDTVGERPAVEYDDRLDVLYITPVALSRPLAGVALARQLLYAYFDLAGTEPHGLDRAAFLKEEVAAFQLQIELLNNVTRGEFERLISECRTRGSLQSISERIAVPDAATTESLNALLGFGDEYENLVRIDLFAAALSLGASRTAVESHNTMEEFLLWTGIDLDWMEQEVWIDHERLHLGSDVSCRPGESVTAPLRGWVRRHIQSITPGDSWRGIVIQGAGSDDGRLVRILGLEPLVPVGSYVDTTDTIGMAQDVRVRFRDLRPYLHVELYNGGRRMDPYSWLEGVSHAEWGARFFLAPDRDSDYQFPHATFLNEGLRLETARRFDDALAQFQLALDRPQWEVNSTLVHHLLARVHAGSGRFQEAARIQERLLELLRLELECAGGSLPDPALGTIAAVRSPESLRLLIFHHELNLAAYRQGRDTVYVYD